VETDFETAEMLKLACNAFHALKVCFANEIGNLCRAEGVDGQRVMDVFVQDRKLNLSACYLKPGLAFGGSCLPKDVGALNDMAEANDLATPVLKAILTSNDDQIELARLAK
jgi:GDP-mannose 6-dehydrogenase